MNPWSNIQEVSNKMTKMVSKKTPITVISRKLATLSPTEMQMLCT
jgi:hypothetical protein